MRFSTRTEYGLICLVHMVRCREGERLTVKELVSHENYSAAYLEKIFQALKAAGIVVSFQGNQGGYALARQPGEITLRQIVEALEGTTFDIFCERRIPDQLICNHGSTCGLKPIWVKTKQLLDHYYDSVTLEMIGEGVGDEARKH